MKANRDILINILTRTSNRPIGFKKCYTSVNKQTYKNIRHIVAYDDKSDLAYLEGLDIDKVYVGDNYNIFDTEQVDIDGNTLAIYNLYCNDLLYEVKEGWILFLDDDNHLFHNKVIEEIVELISLQNNNESIFIWQLRYPNGILLPSNTLIKNKEIKKYNIDSSCYLFNSIIKDKAKWDQFKVSDFRFLKQLLMNVSSTTFINKIVVQVSNFGDLGAKNDISINNKYIDKLIFNKNLFWYLIPKKHFELFGIKIFQANIYKVFINKLKKKIKR